MTPEHPLTNEKALSLFSFEQFADESPPITVEDTMRTAADWQLEQVMNWLDKHLTNYLDPDYLGSCESIPDLEDDLKKAMRPTGDLKALAGTGREGALNALDRLYEENDEGLRRLAQEDN